MNEVLVSVRMPASLVNELNELVEEHHYLDLSELIRSVVRQKWMDAENPELGQLKKLHSNIEQEVKQLTSKRIQQEVNKELRKIQEQLKKGGFVHER